MGAPVGPAEWESPRGTVHLPSAHGRSPGIPGPSDCWPVPTGRRCVGAPAPASPTLRPGLGGSRHPNPGGPAIALSGGDAKSSEPVRLLLTGPCGHRSSPRCRGLGCWGQNQPPPPPGGWGPPDGSECRPRAPRPQHSQDSAAGSGGHQGPGGSPAAPGTEGAGAGVVPARAELGYLGEAATATLRLRAEQRREARSSGRQRGWRGGVASAQTGGQGGQATGKEGRENSATSQAGKLRLGGS